MTSRYQVVGIGNAIVDVLTQCDDDFLDWMGIDKGIMQLVDRERSRLSELMHGPVQGRIAACIMALNFHATSDTDAHPAQNLIDSVLDHLRAVSRDLAQIAAGVGRASP